jgi:hypothetical protein
MAALRLAMARFRGFAGRREFAHSRGWVGSGPITC